MSKVKADLSSFMEQSGKSQRQIADECGLSTAVISQFLNGSYTGDNGKVAETLNK